VILTPADLERANVEATHSIDIVQFVEADEIAPAHWETPYFVEPTNAKSRSYALLRETMRRSKKVGVARLVLRTRQRLAALVVWEDAIVANVIRYAHELRDPTKLSVPPRSAAKGGVTARELAMAEQLVEGLTGPWKPEEYRDEFRDDVLALVQRKVKAGGSEEVEELPTPRRRAKGEVLDLMPLLKESLQKTREVAVAAGSKRTPRKTVRRRRAS
jgi:DNA end-binding protein Ku